MSEPEALSPPPTPMPEISAGVDRVSLAAQGALGVIGIAVVVESTRLNLWTTFGPGPGFFPFVLGAGLVLLAATWAAQTVRSMRAERGTSAATTATPDEDRQEQQLAAEAAPDGAAGKSHALAIIISLVILAAILNFVGFQLSMLAFLIFHLRILGRNRWRVTVPLALVGSVGAFHLFSDLLLVPLPYSALPALAQIGL